MPTKQGEYEGVATRHPGYLQYIADWLDCDTVLQGGRAVKAGGTRFLPQPDGMSLSAYSAYVLRALFYGATGRTVEALTGAVFRRDPKIEAFPNALIEELEDVTLSGVSFNAAAQEIFSRVIGVGREGILVDWSESAKRPYWSHYQAQDIVNWTTQRIDGQQVLTQVILREAASGPSKDEFGTETIDQYRQLVLRQAGGVDGPKLVLHNVIWRSREIMDESGQKKIEWYIFTTMTPVRRGETIGFIPFTFFGSGGVDPMPKRPPLIDLVEVNMAHYRVSADQKHALFLTAQPTPWVTGAQKNEDDDLKIGSSSAWIFESKDTKVGMLEFMGNGVEAMRNDLRDMQQYMSVLGARLLEVPPTQAEAADTVRQRHAGDDAVLQKLSMSVSAGLSQVLRQHAWWAGTGEYDTEIVAQLSQEFFTSRMSSQQLQALILAVQAGQMSYSTFYRQLQLGGIARPGVTEEEERHAIGADEGAGTGAGGGDE